MFWRKMKREKEQELRQRRFDEAWERFHVWKDLHPTREANFLLPRWPFKTPTPPPPCDFGCECGWDKQHSEDIPLGGTTPREADPPLEQVDWTEKVELEKTLAELERLVDKIRDCGMHVAVEMTWRH